MAVIFLQIELKRFDITLDFKISQSSQRRSTNGSYIVEAVTFFYEISFVETAIQIIKEYVCSFGDFVLI